MCQRAGITCCVMQQATVSDCWLINIRSWAILVQTKGSSGLSLCVWPLADAKEEMTGKVQVWSDPAFGTLCTWQLRTLCSTLQQMTLKRHSLMDSSSINLAIPYLNLGILLAASKLSHDTVCSYMPHWDALPFFTLTFNPVSLDATCVPWREMLQQSYVTLACKTGKKL